MSPNVRRAAKAAGFIAAGAIVLSLPGGAVSNARGVPPVAAGPKVEAPNTGLDLSKGSSVAFDAGVPFDQATLRLAGPGDVFVERVFKAGEPIAVDVSDLPDGSYVWELRTFKAPPKSAFRTLDAPDADGRTVVLKSPQQGVVRHGTFGVSGGRPITPVDEPETKE